MQIVKRSQIVRSHVGFVYKHSHEDIYRNIRRQHYHHSVMDMSRFLTDLSVRSWCLAFLVLSSSWRGVQSAPSHRRHHNQRHARRELLAARSVYGNPCRGRRVMQPEEALPGAAVIFTPLQRQLQLLSRDAALARQQVDALMQRYLTERFQRTVKHDDFGDFRLRGLPRIPKVTQEDLYEQIEIQVHTSLNGTYDRLVTMDMFLHDIRLDEINYHGEMGGYTEYLQVISDTHIVNLLCRLRVTMYDLGMRYNYDHVRKAFRHEVRDVTSTALRYMYDYIILRELDNALSYMEVEFNMLRSRALDAKRSRST